MAGSDTSQTYRTPRYGYTDYAVAWLLLHVVLLPVTVILGFESRMGMLYAIPFALAFLLAPVWPGGVVRRAFEISRFYRIWLAVTTALLLAVAIPGAQGKLPEAVFNTWLIVVLLCAAIVLLAAWYRRIRERL